MRKEHLEIHSETYEEFLSSLARGAHNEQGKKYDSGLSEDALYVAQDPNSNFEELPTEPEAGEVGFAPQNTVGGAMGAGGYTQDEMGQIPTIGETTEHELDEWMELADFLMEGQKPLQPVQQQRQPQAKKPQQPRPQWQGSELQVAEDSYMHGDDDHDHGKDCKCKKCMKKNKSYMKGEGKKHCNESVEVDFLTSLANNAKRGRGGW